MMLSFCRTMAGVTHARPGTMWPAWDAELTSLLFLQLLFKFLPHLPLKQRQDCILGTRQASSALLGTFGPLSKARVLRLVVRPRHSLAPPPFRPEGRMALVVFLGQLGQKSFDFPPRGLFSQCWDTTWRNRFYFSNTGWEKNSGPHSTKCNSVMKKWGPILRQEKPNVQV